MGFCKKWQRVGIRLADLASASLRFFTRMTRSDALFCFSTEKNMDPGWKLQPTGRFAHHCNYVKETASRFGWKTLYTEAVDLRREGDSWIRGDIFFLARKE